MTETRQKQAVRFAASSDAWGEPEGIRTGANAAAHGRALLGAAGVDVAAMTSAFAWSDPYANARASSSDRPSARCRAL